MFRISEANFFMSRINISKIKKKKKREEEEKSSRVIKLPLPKTIIIFTLQLIHDYERNFPTLSTRLFLSNCTQPRKGKMAKG